MARVWNGAQLRAKAFQCRGRDIGAEIRRQLAVGGRLDEGEHVGWATPEEVAGDDSGVIGMPMRTNSSAATAAAIGSLSTSTPLQSKMSTKRRANAPSGPVLDCAIESSWQ
jgi:predicted component of type VI protein secretion system